jgi:hypothetical protein
MSLTKKQEAARAAAVKAVRNYETKKLELQLRMRGAIEKARAVVEEGLRECGKEATKTDVALRVWASAFGYKHDAQPWEQQALELSPFISDGESTFAEDLGDPETISNTLVRLLDDEKNAFPSEPDQWTAEEAIKVIEETEPWKESEE